MGDMLQITTDAGEFEIKVLQLSELRGPASIAQSLYWETEASAVSRARAAEQKKLMRSFAPTPAGRPSKRDRRKIIQFRGRKD
jgi:ribosome-associated heat shock protein Hsp15